MRLFTLVSALFLTVAAACAPVDTAERSETIKQTVTVREIDRENRRFVVTGDGRRATLRATDAVQNFDQLEVGDRITIEFTEAVAVGMADPSDTGETLGVSGAVTAPEGAKPGVVAGEVVTAVFDFVSYNGNNNLAVVRTQEGDLLQVFVQPEMRRFAASRTAGDRIVVSYGIGTAISVTPAS